MDLDDLLQEQLGFNPARSMAQQKAQQQQQQQAPSPRPKTGPAGVPLPSPRPPLSASASPMRGAAAATSAPASRNGSTGSLAGLDDPFASLVGGMSKPQPMASGRCAGDQAAVTAMGPIPSAWVLAWFLRLVAGLGLDHLGV
jgi:hypothetical protein